MYGQLMLAMFFALFTFGGATVLLARKHVRTGLSVLAAAIILQLILWVVVFPAP